MRGLRMLGAIFTSWFFGIGGGLAAMGEWERGAAWLASVPVLGVFGVCVMPLALIAIPLVWVASTVHAMARAWRTDAPIRFLHWMPWANAGLTIVIALCLRLFVVEAYKMPSSSMYPALHIGDHLYVDKLSKHFRSWQRGDIVVFVYPCDPSRDYIKRIVALPGDTVEVRCNVVYVNGNAVANELVAGTCEYEDQEETRGSWYTKQCSRYHESLDGNEWDVFHNYDRPARDAQRREGGAAEGDDRDFPRIGFPFPPSCRDAMQEAGRGEVPRAQGKLVEIKPHDQATACEPQYHYVVPDDQVFTLGDNRNNSNDSRVWGGVPVSSIKGRAIAIWWSSHESGRIRSLR